MHWFFTAILALAAALAGRNADAQTHVQGLGTGQSNWCYLSPHLPAGSHVSICQPGASIAAWDPNDPHAAVAPRLQHALVGLSYDIVVVWQGESDATRDPHDYWRRLYELLTRISVRADGEVRPTLLIEIAFSDTREPITAVHRAFATHPRVAFIPTRDLPRLYTADGQRTDHFTEQAYEEVARRIGVCLRTACWAWE